jgi:glutamyl/glutaminyl-tRNA synthetase
VQKAGAVFDPKKFLWLSGDTIRRMPISELVGEVTPFLETAGYASASDVEARREWFEQLVAGEQERIELFSELPARVRPFFEEDAGVTYEEAAEKNARKHDARAELLAEFSGWLEERAAAGEFDTDTLSAGMKAWVKDRELKFPALFQPLRCALTGMPGGRDLGDCITLLGLERTRARIEAAIQRLG